MTLMNTSALFLLLCVAPAFSQETHDANSLSRFSATISELTRRVSPAVVEIGVTGYGATEESKSDFEQVSHQHSSGSGVLVDPAGYVMTNAHVIERATSLKVSMGSPTDGTRSGAMRSPPPRRFDARVIGVDQDTDLALLKIEAGDLPVIEFGNSDKISQGDTVLAIGSPMLLRNSLSVGVVSAPARAIGDDDRVLYIQTDASLNPGDSGGALIDSAGKLIGLTTSIFSKSGGNEGIGFAIPGNLVQTVYLQLRSTGMVSRGTLGITVQNVTPALAHGLSLSVQRGVLITDLEPHSPAAQSGLERRDVIIGLDDEPVRTARQFNENIYGRKAGDKVALDVQRGEERLAFTAVVEKYTEPPNPLALSGAIENNLVSRLGLFCLEIDKKVAEALPDLRVQYGLVVVAMASGSQATYLDFKPGDVIHELNNLPIASLDLFRQRIDGFNKGDAVAMQIERNGHLRYTSFEIE